MSDWKVGNGGDRAQAVGGTDALAVRVRGGQGAGQLGLHGRLLYTIADTNLRRNRARSQIADTFRAAMTADQQQVVV
jgi:hypothetical protein